MKLNLSSRTQTPDSGAHTPSYFSSDCSLWSTCVWGLIHLWFHTIGISTGGDLFSHQEGHRELLDRQALMPMLRTTSQLVTANNGTPSLLSCIYWLEHFSSACFSSPNSIVYTVTQTNGTVMSQVPQAWEVKISLSYYYTLMNLSKFFPCAWYIYVSSQQWLVPDSHFISDTGKHNIKSFV